MKYLIAVAFIVAQAFADEEVSTTYIEMKLPRLKITCIDALCSNPIITSENPMFKGCHQG
jgi:hypothetical protein